MGGRHVRVMIDNTTAVASLNHMGTSHSRECNIVSILIWDLCVTHKIWLPTAHIPGKSNVLADIEFRRSLGGSERIVNCDIF